MATQPPVPPGEEPSYRYVPRPKPVVPAQPIPPQTTVPPIPQTTPPPPGAGAAVASAPWNPIPISTAPVEATPSGSPHLGNAAHDPRMGGVVGPSRTGGVVGPARSGAVPRMSTPPPAPPTAPPPTQPRVRRTAPQQPPTTYPSPSIPNGGALDGGLWNRLKSMPAAEATPQQQAKQQLSAMRSKVQMYA